VKLKRILPVLIISVAATLSMSGCVPFPHAVTADPAPVETQVEPAPETTEAAPPAETEAPVDPAPVETPVEEAPPAEAPVDGTPAAAGTKVGLNTPLVYQYTNTDDGTALISAKLTSVTPATAEQTAELNEASEDIKGYNITFITVELTKLSGAELVYNSGSTGYAPVDAEGNTTQKLIMFSSYEACDQPSFEEEFDTGTPLSLCFIGLAPEGGNAPVGLEYAGGYEENNPYDSFDGEPLLFIAE
jgi:hypothetical protein